MQSIRDAGGITIVVNETSLTMLGELLTEISNGTNQQGRTNPA